MVLRALRRPPPRSCCFTAFSQKSGASASSGCHCSGFFSNSTISIIQSTTNPRQSSPPSVTSHLELGSSELSLFVRAPLPTPYRPTSHLRYRLNPAMTTVDDHSIGLERKRRSTKKGMVTRIRTHLVGHQAANPETYAVSTIEDLGRELKLHLEEYHNQCDIISRIIDEHPELATDDDAVQERHLEEFSSTKSSLTALLDAHRLWGQAQTLSFDMEAELVDPTPNSASFREAAAKLTSQVAPIVTAARTYFKTMPVLKETVDELQEKMRQLRAIVRGADTIVPTPPTPVPVVSAPEPSHSHSTLKIDVPSFDGAPEHWEQFESLFQSTIRTRAKGFSPMEIRGLLRTAVQPEKAKRILDHLPSTSFSLDEMLGELKSVYGDPSVVCPLLVKKIISSTKLGFDHHSLSVFHDDFCLPYRRFCSIAGDSLSAFLAVLAVDRMSAPCRDEWLRTTDSDKIPSMEEVTTFVKKWMLKLPSTANPSNPASTFTPPSVKPNKPAFQRPEPSSTPPRKSQPGCPACGQNHGMLRCSTFGSMDVDRRNDLVRKHKLCINCFSALHGYRQCPVRFSCKSCGGRHHTMLHRDTTPTTAPSNTPTPATPTALPSFTAAATAPTSRFLLTALVTLQNEGNTYHARAILDTGAAISFMSEAAVSALHLKRTFQPLQVAGTMGEGQCKFAVSTKLYSTDNRFQSDVINFTVISKLPHLQTPPNSSEILAHPSLRSYQLADPDLGGHVDLILGVTDSLALFTGETFRVQGMVAVPTQLGLCLSGPMLTTDPPLALVATVPPTDLQSDLSKLWELDQVPESPEHSSEDQRVIEEFNQTYSFSDGRFSVSLPKVPDPPKLGESRRQAVSRLLQNEKSLAKKGKLESFQAAVREYVDLGHAHRIPFQQLHPATSHFYLPVHGVFKDCSTTTKVRAVFDASARTSSSHSLNDTLLSGPNLYPPLTDILLRFRRFPVGMSADISKMFREILLNPGEKDLHRFMMRDTDGRIVDCRMDRLTFGVKCSPYLATQVLHTLASLHSSSHPSASYAITHNFYVDDFLAGAATVEDASSLQQEISDLLSKAGMTLRKWRSNSTALLDSIPEELHDSSSSIHIHSPSLSPKALGVHWDVANDCLHVSIPELAPPTRDVTKRQIASATAGVFDVLGLLSPAILPARVLFQDTWKRSLTWDDPVPEDMAESWATWVEDLQSVNGHAIPRRLSLPSGPHSEELHGFCDASSYAYGVSIYLRASSPDGSIHVSLVTAKSRVLPVKPVTIPKAELLGAHLLARLLSHTSSVMDIPLGQIHAWSDSEIVLHWLPKSPPQLDRFVANRVHSIQRLLPSVKWHHVPTSSNPADLASRGVRAPDLAMSALWWSGPAWLSLPQSQWPDTKINKPTVPALVASIRHPSTPPPSVLSFIQALWKRFSSFFHLVRVCCYVLRFIHNSRSSSNVRVSGPLSSEEVEKSKSLIYKLAQSEFYSDVFISIDSKRILPKSHPLHRFHLSISGHGHILASSRIRNPEDPVSPNTLTVLPKDSELTKLLLRSLHIVYSHAGVSAMHSVISHSFLIPSLRSLLKLISRSCVVCQRAYARPLAHSMGLLPLCRTTPAPPFSHTGVDFAGPFTLRVGHTRKPSYLKTYAVVFVCMGTKAVHFDLAASLSTTDFLATLERFVARRGAPNIIYSDNGSNFLGAREEIRELQKFSGSVSTKQAISNFAAQNNIQWKNIPPRAPHFGGLWEAAVRSMKIHLRKNLRHQRLRWDELYSILTDAEAMLNSRPLSPLHSDEAEETSFLTAGHFLIGRPIRALPSKLPSTSPLSHLKRWNLVLRLKADLWKRWTASYLSSISQRSKWFHPGRQLKPGDIVFLKDETMKVRDWPIARVTRVHPGHDGVIRVVDITCQGKTYRRPAVKIVPALTDEDFECSTPSNTPTPTTEQTR